MGVTIPAPRTPWSVTMNAFLPRANTCCGSEAATPGPETVSDSAAKLNIRCAVTAGPKFADDFLAVFFTGFFAVFFAGFFFTTFFLTVFFAVFFFAVFFTVFFLAAMVLWSSLDDYRCWYL